MTFRERLENHHSKASTSIIVSEICKHPKKMEELMQTFVAGPLRITQRAAWPLSYVAQNNSTLLTSYYDILINELYNPNNHNAIKRNILRALQYTNIPTKYQGKVLNRCFEFLHDNNQPIAIHAFSMTIAYNLSKEYPNIIPELKSSIELLMPNGSAGVRSRGNKILKQLNK